MAQVLLTQDAQRDLAQLPRTIHARVQVLLERLSAWPHVSGAKPLRGEWRGHYRLRTGDWRLIFRLQGQDVIVVRIENRKDAYDADEDTED